MMFKHSAPSCPSQVPRLVDVHLNPEARVTIPEQWQFDISLSKMVTGGTNPKESGRCNQEGAPP